MGVDAADFDEDGWQDLFVANVDQEMFSLYRNNRDGSFSDVAHSSGVAQDLAPLAAAGAACFPSAPLSTRRSITTAAERSGRLPVFGQVNIPTE